MKLLSDVSVFVVLRFAILNSAVWFAAICPLSRAADEGALDSQPPADEAVQNADEGQPQMKAGTTAATIGRVFGAILGANQFDDYAEYEEAASPLIGEPAPDVQLATLDGETVRLSDLKGKVVVLDFWATWSGPCLAAMPHLDKVQASFDQADVKLIGVNQGDDEEQVRETIEEKNVSFSQAVDEDGQVGEALQVRSMPQTVLIDKQGVVQAVHYGYLPTLRTTLVRQIEQLLDGRDLFDKEEVAAARELRNQRRAEAEAKLGFCHDDRLQRIVADPGQFGTAAYLDAPYQQSQWVELPDQRGRAMAFFSEEDLIIFEPRTRKTEKISPRWNDDEDVSLWDAAAVIRDGALCWAFLGAVYDDDYNNRLLHVSLVDQHGDELWRRSYEALEDEAYLDADVAAADLDGDGQSEVVLLVEDSGLGSLGLVGPGFSSRVLTVYDAGGKTLLRTWAPGEGGPGLYVLPGESGESLLMGDGTQLAEFRVNLPVTRQDR